VAGLAGAVRQVEERPQAVHPVAKAGVWEKVFTSLTGDPDNQYLMLDTTLIRVHQQAAGGKGGPKINRTMRKRLAVRSPIRGAFHLLPVPPRPFHGRPRRGLRATLP